MNLDSSNIHEPMSFVDILDDVDNRLIEQKIFAIFGPDADLSGLTMVIETFSETNRPNRVLCQVRNVLFWVNRPGRF